LDEFTYRKLLNSNNGIYKCVCATYFVPTVFSSNICSIAIALPTSVYERYVMNVYAATLLWTEFLLWSYLCERKVGFMNSALKYLFISAYSK
jgi:hypothetical protein